MAGFGWLVAGWAPAHAYNCFNLVHDWRQHVGLGPALEIMARQCLLAENIPLVAATLQYGRSVPELYEHYEENTVQHKLMRETANLPGVHAFCAEAGMGKSTVRCSSGTSRASTASCSWSFCNLQNAWKAGRGGGYDTTKHSKPAVESPHWSLGEAEEEGFQQGRLSA